MNILGHELSTQANEICKDLKSNIKINLSICKDTNTYVSINSNHSYTIHISEKPLDTLEFRFIHEMCHIYQFENGYYRISKCLIKDRIIQKLLIHINDFVLDTDVHERLRTIYDYNIHDFSKHEKYNNYIHMVSNIPNNSLNSIGAKILAIECAYIYFNDSAESAMDLINKSTRISTQVKEYFDLIISEYSHGITTSSEFAKEKILHICHILDLDECYSLDVHQ